MTDVFQKSASNSNMPVLRDTISQAIASGTTFCGSEMGKPWSAGTQQNTYAGTQLNTCGVNAGQMTVAASSLQNTLSCFGHSFGSAVVKSMTSTAVATAVTGTTSGAATYTGSVGSEVISTFHRTKALRLLMSQSDTTDVGVGGLNLLRHLISFWTSQFAKADALFLSIVREVPAEESEAEPFRQELAHFLDKFGSAGMQVILNRLLRNGVSSEIRHMFLLEIAKIEDESTIGQRRSVLERAMRSTDASVRYSAAVALGSMPNDHAARSVLSSQRAREKNPAVRKMIQAQLA
jgi:hypothetical protein